MPVGLAAGLGGALLGGVAGAIPRNSSSTSSINMRDPGRLENFLYGSDDVKIQGQMDAVDKQIATYQSQLESPFLGSDQKAIIQQRIDEQQQKKQSFQSQKGQKGYIENQFGQLNDYINAGPGQSDIEASLGASRGLADMLQQYSQGGFLPSESDISTANTQAGNLFQAQRTALSQAFEDQTIEANRRAAIQGRAGNDPILAAKLAQEQTRQSAMLQSQQGSLAQQLAMAMPGQRLGFASDRANLMGGLASQAMANRQAILSLGSQLGGNERNFRFSTADRTNNQSSGGGFGGFMSGMLGGAGMGLSAASSFSSMPSFGSGIQMPAFGQSAPGGAMAGGQGPSLGTFQYNQPSFGNWR